MADALIFHFKKPAGFLTMALTSIQQSPWTAAGPAVPPGPVGPVGPAPAVLDRVGGVGGPPLAPAASIAWAAWAWAGLSATNTPWPATKQQGKSS